MSATERQLWARFAGVTVRHVWRLVFERRIPILTIKWGHLFRFDQDEVVA